MNPRPDIKDSQVFFEGCIRRAALKLAALLPLAATVFSSHAGVIAYWRMEAQVSTFCFGTPGVADSATATGQGALGGNCGAGATDDPLITFNGAGGGVAISSTVPPSSMFNAGFSGGTGSYNSESLLGVDGALFFAQDRYGDEFSTPSWTVEMFIKSDGDQSGNGFQQLLKNEENNWRYGLDLNESAPGGLRLFVQNSQGFPVCDLTDRNYADGQWHYLVCSYSQPSKRLTIRVRSQNGQVSRNSIVLSSDPFVGTPGNFFLGRNTYPNNQDPRTFRGLIDEVRISDNLPSDSALVGKINPDGTNALAYWRFESVLPWGSATNFARFQDYATAVNQGTAAGGGGATPSQDYLNIYPGDTGVVISNLVPPAAMFNAGFGGGTNSMYCQGSTATATFDPARFGSELETPNWTMEAFYKANGNQAGSDTSEANRMQLLRKDNWNYGLVANEASPGSLRLFAQQTDGAFVSADLTDRNYSDGTWQYVVCSYLQSSKTLTIRVRSENGLVSRTSATLTADPKTDIVSFFVGAQDASGARRVRGWMDEARMSDNVQSDSALIGRISADSTNLVTSSLNSATYGSSITLTARVSAVVSGNGTPTGSVQFRDNGVAVGSPVALGSGMATVSTATLTAGSHLITAEYAGDSKFYGSTNSFTQTVTSKALTMNGLSVPTSKVYDATTAASVSGTPALQSPEAKGSGTSSDGKPYSGDTVSIAGTATGTYDSKDVPTATSVSFGGLSLTGAQAANYTLTIQSPVSATITTKALAMSGLSVPASKVYDGTQLAAVTGTPALQPAEPAGSGTASDGNPYNGDAVNITGAATGTYDSKDVATASSVSFGGLSLSGAQAANYSLSLQSLVPATITPLAASLLGSRAYDGTTNADAAVLSVANRIGGDTVNVGSGTGGLDDKNFGVRNITSFGTLALGNNSAGNYTLAGATGSVTITQAVASLLVSSSENPSGFQDAVDFNAGSLPADATGVIIFRTNGVALSTNSIVGGSAASATTTLLPRGTNTITAEYAGDSNYVGSTNNLAEGQVVTNHPPVAALLSIRRAAGLSLKIALADVATNWSDPDADPSTLAGINLVTTNGVTLTTNESYIFYSNDADVDDQLSYTISDGQGGISTGFINISVMNSVTGQTQTITVSNNTVIVNFAGIPNYSYSIQRSTNLVDWVTRHTTNAPPNGLFQYTDDFTDLGGNPPAAAYYRLSWSP